jgi:hypothetical protein
MSPRDTTTGAVLESMVFPALVRGKYKGKLQVFIGDTPTGKRHRVDILAENEQGEKILISMKWQQIGGTAEEKVPYEVIKLIHAKKHGNYKSVYLVLGGNGWSMKEFYIKGGLDEYIRESQLVHIVDLDTFVALANSGKL